MHPGDLGMTWPSADHQHRRLPGAGTEPVQSSAAASAHPRPAATSFALFCFRQTPTAAHPYWMVALSYHWR
jgi:hypothetical protein